MTKQSTTQFADAIRAFAARFEALTWAVGQNVFPNNGRHSASEPGRKISSVVFTDETMAVADVVAWPRIALHVATFGHDSDNDTGVLQVRIAAQIQQRDQFKGEQDFGDAALFGFGKGSTTTDAHGAGLLDLIAKVTDEVGYVDLTDDSEIDSYIQLDPASSGTTGRTRDYWFATLQYEGVLRSI